MKKNKEKERKKEQKKKEKQTQINKIKDEKGKVTTDFNEIESLGVNLETYIPQTRKSGRN